MAGTMEGLGVPINGGYTAYQSDGTTAFLTVNADGTHDFTFTDEGADNFIGITVSQTTAVTSGYIQAFYANVTVSGGITAPAQINAFAADITVGGACAGEVSGVYIYFAETGTFTSAHIHAGFTVYFAAFASATPALYRAGVHCYSAEASSYIGSSMDAGLLVESSGASGTWGSMLGHMGVTPPAYFLWMLNAPGTENMIGTGALGNPAACTTWLKVLIQSTTYWIPLHASCTS